MQRGREVKIAIMALLLAKWDVYGNACHNAKIPQKDVSLFPFYEIYLEYNTIDIYLSKPQQDE